MLDPFIGSGMTAVAAAGTDRHYVGVDIDEQYIGLARARLRDARPA